MQIETISLWAIGILLSCQTIGMVNGYLERGIAFFIFIHVLV